MRLLFFKAADILSQGLKKNPGYIKKNPARVGFIGDFWVLLGIFLDFTWNSIVGFKFYFKREQF